MSYAMPISRDAVWNFSWGNARPAPVSDPRSRYRDAMAADAAFFAANARIWREETLYLSDIEKIVAHRSYRQIVAMKERALPHIFVELLGQPDHWFAALAEITG